MSDGLASIDIMNLGLGILETVPPLIIAGIVFGPWWRARSKQRLKKIVERETV